MRARDGRNALLLVLPLALLLWAHRKPHIETEFTEGEMREIEAEVERRLSEFKSKRWQACQAEIRDLADAHVDSLLARDIRKLLAKDPSLADDTPPKPLPPERPEPLAPADSTPLKPLLPGGDLVE